MTAPYRIYAIDTEVTVDRSIRQIENLLRVWGAVAIQWSKAFHPEGGDGDRAVQAVQLRFSWNQGTWTYRVRYDVICPTHQALRAKWLQARGTEIKPPSMDKQLRQRPRAAMRWLADWIKLSFEGIRSGHRSMEQVFFGDFEDAAGVTVWEAKRGELHAVLEGRQPRLMLTDRETSP